MLKISVSILWNDCILANFTPSQLAFSKLWVSTKLQELFSHGLSDVPTVWESKRGGFGGERKKSFTPFSSSIVAVGTWKRERALSVLKTGNKGSKSLLLFCGRTTPALQFSARKKTVNHDTSHGFPLKYISPTEKKFKFPSLRPITRFSPPLLNFKNFGLEDKKIFQINVCLRLHSPRFPPSY